MVSFVIKDKEGGVVQKYEGAACFARLWGMREPAADHIEYKPVLEGVTREVALQYFAELKKIPFKISQSPEEIIDVGYHLKLADFRRAAGHISIPEVIGTLSVVRYVYECWPCVHRFLNLIELDPEVDRWKALFASNYVTAVAGTLDTPSNQGIVNGNHTIGSPYEHIAPFKEWEEVEAAFDDPKTAWNGYHCGLQRHFGILMGKQPLISVIGKKEDFQEFVAQCGK